MEDKTMILLRKFEYYQQFFKKKGLLENQQPFAI